MSPQRKSILVAGLGSTVSDTARETLKFDETIALVTAEVEQAKAGGFDCTIFIVEPSAPKDTLEKLRARLQSRKWDAFSIGFAVRGLKENTQIFEVAVNMAIEIDSKSKFIFPLDRQDIWAATKRAFAVEE